MDAVFTVCYARRTLQRAKHFIVSSVGGTTRFANLWWKFSKTYKSAADFMPYTSYGYHATLCVSAVFAVARCLSVRLVDCIQMAGDIGKLLSSDVNKDWTCKDKDQAYKDHDKDLNLVLKQSLYGQGQGLHLQLLTASCS